LHHVVVYFKSFPAPSFVAIPPLYTCRRHIVKHDSISKAYENHGKVQVEFILECREVQVVKVVSRSQALLPYRHVSLKIP